MIKMQLKLMFSKPHFYIVLILCTVMSIVFFITAPDTPVGMVSHEFLYWGNYYTRGFSIFSTIYPFLLVVPFATSVLDDVSKRTCTGIFLRGDRKSYVIGKYIAVFAGNFLIIFIPFLLNLLLCFGIYGSNARTPFGERRLGNLDNMLYGTRKAYHTLSNKLLFADIFDKNPFLFYFLYLLLLAFLTGMLGVFVMSVSMWMRRYKIFLFLPVYILMRIGSTYTSMSLNRALANPNRTFVNLNLTDYAAPFGLGGCYYPILIGFMALIAVFAVVSGIHMTRREII